MKSELLFIMMMLILMGCWARPVMFANPPSPFLTRLPGCSRTGPAWRFLPKVFVTRLALIGILRRVNSGLPTMAGTRWGMMYPRMN